MTINKKAIDSANANFRIVKQTRILPEIEETELIDLAIRSFNDSNKSSAPKSFIEMNKFIDELEVKR